MTMLLKRGKRNVYLYFRLFSQQLKAILEYQADFLIMVVAAALTQLLGIVFLWAVYSRIPDINGWLFWEVVFMYAMIYMSEGFASLFFDGTWRLGGLVNRGEFDTFLLRPVSPILQVLSAGVGMNGLGNIVIGAIMVWQSFLHMDMAWTFGKVAITALLLLTAVAIRVAINLAANTSAFWIKNAGNAFPLMIHTLSDFAKYPITIFTLGIQLLVAILVPFAFISFFPATYLFGKAGAEWFWLLPPAAVIYCSFIAYVLFRLGLKSYESTGN